VRAGDVRVVASGDPRRGEFVAQKGNVGTVNPVPPVAGATPSGTRPIGDQTSVFVVPRVESSRAVLREIRPDGSSRTLMVDGSPLTIGRAPDNKLVLADSRASRHHARLYGRRGALILTDLGSTNGSWVNDRRIDEMALGEGDQIRIGDTILVVERVEPTESAEKIEPGPERTDGAG
jgi:hypothetical protein